MLRPRSAGTTERRAVWVSEELATYADFPGLTSVIRVHQVVRDDRSGRERDSVQYGMSSLSDLAPDRALALLRGHWEIENRLFYVKDDGFGEDRQVLQHHHSGLVMSLLRGAGLTLLRGNCPLWSDGDPSPAEHNASQPIPQQHSHHPTTDFEKALRAMPGQSRLRYIRY